MGQEKIESVWRAHIMEPHPLPPGFASLCGIGNPHSRQSSASLGFLPVL